MRATNFALAILAELVPLFILVSTLVYLVVDVLTPQRIQRWLGGGSPLLKVPLASTLGALTPFCSCSTVPIVHGMRLAGVPTAPLVAFLIASPLISPVAIALLWSAMGAEYAVLYTATAMVSAAVGGVAIARWHRAHEALPLVGSLKAVDDACGCSDPGPARANQLNWAMRMSVAGAAGGPAVLALPLAVSSHVATSGFARRLAGAFLRSLSDLRKLALPLLIAVTIGAAIYGYVPTELLVKVAGPDTSWAVPGAALLSIPVYGSILVVLPLASTLLAKGVGIGAVTAFLMGANGFSLPEGILLSRILPGSLLWRIVLVFAAGVIGIGYLFQALVG